MKKFIRRSDVVLLTDLTNQVRGELNVTMREAVDMVYESLSGESAYAIPFWRIPKSGGLPEPFESRDPNHLLCSFFNSAWWDEAEIKHHLDPQFVSIDFEITEELALATLDAEALLKHIRDHCSAPSLIQDTSRDEAYLNPSHPRYSPKLAAAVKAWLAISDPGKKSPKQALEKWLREHAAELGIANNANQPIQQAVEECAKVANWQPKGGAPKASPE